MFISFKFDEITLFRTSTGSWHFFMHKFALSIAKASSTDTTRFLKKSEVSIVKVEAFIESLYCLACITVSAS